MTITITHYETTYSTIFPDGKAGLDAMIRAFVNLLIASGYPRESIIGLFKDGDPNAWDSAWPVPGRETA